MGLIHLQNTSSIKYTIYLVMVGEVRRGNQSTHKEVLSRAPSQLFKGTATQCSGSQLSGKPRALRNWDRGRHGVGGPQRFLRPQQGSAFLARTPESSFHITLWFSRKQIEILRGRSSKSPGSAHTLLQPLNRSGGHWPTSGPPPFSCK